MERIEQNPPHLIVGGFTADYPDPENFLRTGLSSLNMNWRNPEYDRLLSHAQTVTDQEERLNCYRRMDRILTEEAVVIPLLYGRSHYLVQPWVKQFPVSPIGDRYWEDIVIDRS